MYESPNNILFKESTAIPKSLGYGVTGGVLLQNFSSLYQSLSHLLLPEPSSLTIVQWFLFAFLNNRFLNFLG